LDPGTGPDSKGTMDVLLVAAKKEKIADYTGVIAQAGRVPVVVDVDAFALQNAYEINYGLDPQAVTVLLNAGASAININILSGGASRVDGFRKALEDRFATVIEPFNQFQKVTFDAAKLGISDPENLIPSTAVAVGLALRRAGDR